MLNLDFSEFEDNAFDQAVKSVILWMGSNPKVDRVQQLYKADDLWDLPEVREDSSKCLEALVAEILRGAEVTPTGFGKGSEIAEMQLREAPYQYGYAPKRNSWMVSQALVDALRGQFL